MRYSYIVLLALVEFSFHSNPKELLSTIAYSDSASLLLTGLNQGEFGYLAEALLTIICICLFVPI